MLSIPTGHFQAPMIMKSVHIRFYNFICRTIWITVIHGHECSIWINWSSNVTAIDNCKIDPGVMVKKPKALKCMNLHFRVSLFFHLSEPNGAIRQLIGICCPTEWIHAYGCSSQIGDHVNRRIQKQTHLQLVIHLAVILQARYFMHFTFTCQFNWDLLASSEHGPWCL